MGEHRTEALGLFENLKSKYGADGELNTGSSGSYKQLIGSFTTDGGLTDANPGYASRDYAEGSVVFKSAGVADDSGYFMALSSVKAGVKIEAIITNNSVDKNVHKVKDLRKHILLHQILIQTVSSTILQAIK